MLPDPFNNILTVKRLSDFMANRKSIVLEQVRKRKSSKDVGFNPFGLMSDVYHRENFHSDVIRSILEVRGKHGCGDQYMSLFIELINTYLVDRILLSNYTQDVIIHREKGKRDITIDGMNGHCIIIENKINDARDMQNQIPRYVKQVEADEKILDAIVYLTLNQAKEPDEGTWEVTDCERTAIKSKLISLRAYSGKDKELDLSYWLRECLKLTPPDNLDAVSVLHSYLTLLCHLTSQYMDFEYMDNFYNSLKAEHNSDVLLGIYQAAEDLPWYISTKVFNHFKKLSDVNPFEKIEIWKDYGYFLHNWRIVGFQFNLDIVVPSLEYSLIDFSARIPSWDQTAAELVLEILDFSGEFIWNNAGRFERRQFGDFLTFEEDMITFIIRFLKAIHKHEAALTKALEKLAAQRSIPSAIA